MESIFKPNLGSPKVCTPEPLLAEIVIELPGDPLGVHPVLDRMHEQATGRVDRYLDIFLDHEHHFRVRQYLVAALGQDALGPVQIE